MTIQSLFSFADIMRFSGYEGVPGGKELIAQAEAQTQNLDDVCKNRHRGADTSVLANPSASAKAKQLRTILGALSKAGEASCERLEIVTGISHQSCSARLSEALRDGRIVVCGRTTTISGKPARLYRICG